MAGKRVGWDEVLPEQTAASIEQLKARHAEIKALSESLDSRIRSFEEWVATLPGRVETTLATADPEGDQEYTLVLQLDRLGKKWTVNYGYMFQGDPDLDTKPLTDAGVKAKVLILPLLPRLIDSMVESQETLAKEIKAATKQFDAFAARMKIPQKGEK